MNIMPARSITTIRWQVTWEAGTAGAKMAHVRCGRCGWRGQQGWWRGAIGTANLRSCHKCAVSIASGRLGAQLGRVERRFPAPLLADMLAACRGALAGALSLLPASAAAAHVVGLTAAAGCRSGAAVRGVHSSRSSSSSSGSGDFSHVIDEHGMLVGSQTPGRRSLLPGSRKLCTHAMPPASGSWFQPSSLPCTQRLASPPMPTPHSAALYTLSAAVTKHLWKQRYTWTEERLRQAAPRDPSAAAEAKPPNRLSVKYPFNSDPVVKEHVRSAVRWCCLLRGLETSVQLAWPTCQGSLLPGATLLRPFRPASSALLCACSTAIHGERRASAASLKTSTRWPVLWPLTTGGRCLCPCCRCLL